MKAYPSLLTSAVAVLLSAFAPTMGHAQATGAGSALSFNGIDGRVVVPPGVWFNGNFTVEAWLYLRSHRPWSRLIDFGNGPYAQNVFVGLDSDGTGRPVIATYDVGDSTSLFYSPGQLPLNKWAHLAVVFSTNGNFASIYINGELAGSGPLPLTPPNVVRSNNYIGASNWPWDPFADAIFDEVRIWNSARAKTQIAATMFTRVQGTETNLLGYWRFNEASGTQTADSSGHGATGTLVGGVSWINSTAPISGVSPLAYWPMGENDGSSVGSPTTYTIDSVQLYDLPVSGNAVYSADVPDGVFAGTPSSRSIDFRAPASRAVGSLVSTLQNNFGVEAWVKPASVTNSQVIVYNGHTGTSGWGIVLNASNYFGLFGGRVAFGVGAATANVWTHVALVRDNGVSTLYVNGVPCGTSSVIPNVPTGSFALGTPPQNPTSDFFTGLMDEVRVFTFAPGQFSTNDLRLNRPTRPAVTTIQPNQLTSDSATFRANVNSRGLPTAAWFEWGLFTPFGQRTPLINLPATNSPVAISSALSNLVPGLTYQYRAVASNALGITRGQHVQFCAPTLTINGSDPLFVKRGTTWVDPGATPRGLPMALAGGADHSVALKADRTVVAWGTNTFQQLDVPPGATDVVAIDCGANYSLALKADGTIVGWGLNGGQLNIPAEAVNVAAVAAGDIHALALKADGTLLGWGWNGFGQVTIPAGATDVIAIATHFYHSAALRGDGTVLAWGTNNYQQLNVPPSATNVVAIAAGPLHNLALRADGTVLAWGGFSLTNIPPGVTNVVAIATGWNHSLALKGNGTMMAWGDNYYGQITIPPDATNVVAIAAGGNHNLALKADGTVLAWGNSVNGQTAVPAGLDILDLPVSTQSNVNTNVPRNYQLNYSVMNAYGVQATASRGVMVFDSPFISGPYSATIVGTNAINGLRTVRFTAFVNPLGAPTLVTIAYGLTVGYGNSAAQIVPAGFTWHFAAIDVPLSPGFTWHWRVVATNGIDIFPLGAFSPDQVFAVPPATATIAGDSNGDGIVNQSELDAVYANYLPTSGSLAMIDLAGLGQTNVTFALSNSLPGGYTVEFSTNLYDWQPLGPALPRYQFTDTNAPALPQRYYRLRYP